MKKMLIEGNQIHNFISSSGSGTVIIYGSGSDFLTSYGSGSTSQNVSIPTVLVKVPQHWFFIYQRPPPRPSFPGRTNRPSRWPHPSELLAAGRTALAK